MANMEKDNKLYSVIFAFNIKVSKEMNNWRKEWYYNFNRRNNL